MKKLALALPVAFLALSLDRVLPEKPRTPAPPKSVELAAAVADLPGLNTGRLGRVGNPLNLVFVGSETSLRAALSAAGWTEVPGTIRASVGEGIAELLTGRTVAAAPPMSEYRLDGRRQDINWAISTKFLSARHHFRVWDTGMRDDRGRAIWWGAGDYDLAIRWHDLSHVRDPDIDAERDFVAASLKDSPRLERVTLTPVERIPREGANDRGYKFHSDGRAAVIELR